MIASLALCSVLGWFLILVKAPGILVVIRHIHASILAACVGKMPCQGHVSTAQHMQVVLMRVASMLQQSSLAASSTRPPFADMTASVPEAQELKVQESKIPRFQDNQLREEVIMRVITQADVCANHRKPATSQ